ncbi:HD domain-containing protein [Oceanobacillus massiliensis]|uniref:HD domain-containing protein n=1 Tax=Oceanobacillus massiliensis TaxID=1465765 RepID=UPI00028864E3|nr:HD domain-containing protein [Oceanobacillus massiliensis]
MKEKAREFAELAHKGQTRKNSDSAYITHPIRVAERLEQAGFSETLVCAGYLHDVVEDTPIEIEEIEREFGPETARIVAAHTEDKSKSWQERKQHTIDTVKYADKEIKCLIIADKLDNLLGLEEDLTQLGQAIWKNFNAGAAEQAWYNRSIVNHMYEGFAVDEIPDFFKTYEEAVKRVFG